MTNANHGGFENMCVTHGQILEFDRGNPLSARLDNVFGTVGDPHIAVLVQCGDIVGIEIAVFVKNGIVTRVVLVNDAWATNLQPSDVLAVVGQVSALIVCDLHFNQEGGDA